MADLSFIIDDINFKDFKLPIEKRDCYQEVFDYAVSNKKETRVCALYGLRRTGKTILMQQIAVNLPQELKQKTKFITCSPETSFYDVQHYIDVSIKNGYKIFSLMKLVMLTVFRE